MKKLFMFLTVAGLATFGVSCSSDDNSSDSGQKNLVVISDKAEVEEGDTVTFTVKAGDKTIDDAKLLIGKREIQNPHTFDKEGTYQVQAQREGYADSKSITIKVKKKDNTDPDKKTLELYVDKSDIKVGDTVTFVVKVDGKEVTDFVIQLIGGTELNGLTWKAEKAGLFKFKAEKTGFNSSREVLVSVKEDTPEPTENFILVGNKVFNINYGRLMANAFEKDGSYYIYTYADDEENEYCIFYMLAAELNKEQTQYLGFARIAVAVFQEKGSSALTFPGEKEQGSAFLNAAAVDFVSDSEPIVAEFALEDLTAFSFAKTGGAGTVDMGAENSQGKFKYIGDYTGVGVVEVDTDGNLKGATGIRSVAKYSSDNQLMDLQKQVTLTKRLKK